jgi:predicted transcriptional regulator
MVMEIIFILILSAALLAITVGFAVEYYRNLVKTKREYEKAKDVLNDVILSFSRELKRVAESMGAVAFKVEVSSARSEEAISRVGALEGRIGALENVWKNLDKIIGRFEDVEKQVRDVVASQKDLTAKVSLLEEKSKQTSPTMETGIESVIPIRRERALANLTETELTVLEMLATEGPKTAPEIKERIKLSREHTARLMKKLYEEGYVERDASKIPFKYSVKKEMESLLKKTET